MNPIEKRPFRRHVAGPIAGLCVGLAAGAALFGTWGGLGGGGGDPRAPALLAAGILPPAWAAQAAGLFAAQTGVQEDDAEFLFLPTRRTIWVVHRKTGRFAQYRFKDDTAGTVEVSRVVTVDKTAFPPEDTVYLLSDRNLTEVLWVCNKRTGDVQLWTPRSDGRVVAERPIATSIDLAPPEVKTPADTAR